MSKYTKPDGKFDRIAYIKDNDPKAYQEHLEFKATEAKGTAVALAIGIVVIVFAAAFGAL